VIETDLDTYEFCYVTTKGRRTGRPHTIEIWFAARGDTLYILSAVNTDWVRNALADPSVVVKVGERAYRARARVAADGEEATYARATLPAKYAHREDGLEEWAETADPIAIDLGPA
jgi:deazaflavin-dependent oxidoreductase (nitroreductase family)